MLPLKMHLRRPLVITISGILDRSLWFLAALPTCIESRSCQRPNEFVCKSTVKVTTDQRIEFRIDSKFKAINTS